MEYKIFDATFNPEEDLGLTCVSFVDEPAICCDFQYYSKDGKAHKTDVKQGEILMTNAEKHEVISPLLIPNQLILRVDENGEKYYIRWSKQVIADVAKYYKLNGFQNNFSILHSFFDENSTYEKYEDSFIKNVYMLKLWLIEDEKNDEATKFGYHLPEGTLMCKLKIHNRKLWSRIKSGELKGLSIEAFIPSTFSGTIKYNKINKMTKKTKFQKLKEAFDNFLLIYNQTVDTAEELADIAKSDETESGEVSLKYYTSDTDYIEIKEGGVAVASDGSTVEDGEYPLVDGSVIVIADGKFVETKVKEDAEEKPVEAPVAEEKENDEEKPSDKGSDKKKDQPAYKECDKKKDKEEEMQEEVEIDAPYTLVPVMVDGVEFQVPQEVADYIHTLEEGLSSAEEVSENFRKEIAQMKERIPSTKPITTVVKQSKEEVVEKPSFATLIGALNKKF